MLCHPIGCMLQNNSIVHRDDHVVHRGLRAKAPWPVLGLNAHGLGVALVPHGHHHGKPGVPQWGYPMPTNGEFVTGYMGTLAAAPLKHLEALCVGEGRGLLCVQEP